MAVVWSFNPVGWTFNDKLLTYIDNINILLQYILYEVYTYHIPMAYILYTTGTKTDVWVQFDIPPTTFSGVYQAPSQPLVCLSLLTLSLIHI